MMGAFESLGGAVYELHAGAHALGVVSFRGVEQVSKPYGFEIVATSVELDAGALERALLDQPARFVMAAHEGAPRVVHGVVRRVEIEGTPEDTGGERRRVLRVWIAPRLWRLGRNKNSRIFQDKSAREIIEEILAERLVPARFVLVRDPERRPYCVQYEESDLRFITRLLAEEGISYAFDHAPIALESEVVVFSDSAALAPPIAEPPRLEARDDAALGDDDRHVRRLRRQHQIRPGSALLRDFDFARPMLDLHAIEAVAEAGAAIRVYDHHGTFEAAPADAPTARVRLEQRRVRASVASGESRCRHLTAGRYFELQGSASGDLDGRYTVLRVEHEGRHPEGLRDAGAGVVEVYKNRFEAVPEGVAPRPKAPRRKVQQVLETAIVVGPEGQEIHTDAMGRVRVRFHWDRSDTRRGDTSCWIRAMQSWAGAGWGFQFIPRVGMEVLVMFIGGDVDRPMIVGSAYNAEHPPPYALPANKTKSGIRTRSSRGGGGYNEIAFEDRAGRERVIVHAQRDLDVTVLHDEVARIGADRTVEVRQNDFALVGRNRIESVDGELVHVVGGDEKRTIEGDLTSRVGGDAFETVNGSATHRVVKDLTTEVAGRERREVRAGAEVAIDGDLSLGVRGSLSALVGRHDAKRSYVVHVEGLAELTSAGPTTIASDESITLSCGKSALRLTPDGIEIFSPRVTIAGDDAGLTIAEKKVKIRAGELAQIKAEEVVLKASGASVALASEAKIDGSKIQLGSGASASDSAPSREAKVTKIALVDQHGDPIPYQRFVLVMGDGSEKAGFLDAEGKAEVEIDEAADIVFPGLIETASA